MKVADILRAKGSAVVTVGPDTGVAVALHRLKTGGIGALVVSADGERIDGILSERDIVHGLADRGAGLLDCRVRDVMEKHVATCRADDTLQHVMGEMTRRRVRHLPVVGEGGRVAGMISIGDIVKARFEELELEANVLREAYLARH
jgi:CBS domain-containing protein